ncbi:MAG TPA: guanitoxin biosynthesis heme-dependent pre-guanitoxin N-hydroxylase GntA [Pyrinomonadaceae bacterium]|nr:guanitoxin biosynthesis heme-dependent pre-guanitoxin N-hydroxylase GntA [Pyrinomonadaceae bacterium]
MSQALRDLEALPQKNPFNDASANSAYAAWSRGRLVHPLEPARSPSALMLQVHDSFRAHVLAPEFSCVGGKAAINKTTYRFGFYAEMCSEAATIGLAYDLWEYVRERPSFGTEYATYIASFAAPFVSDELEWEQLLWSQLQSLHDLDCVHHTWDPRVSHDPADPGFSFSFAETGFFVVGLHPASSRRARRFAWPTLVFNAHEQFEHLREHNQFERLRETVRARDYQLQGSLNPNLSDFGERSEARQYSGRPVEEGWRCPFRARSGGVG